MYEGIGISRISGRGTEEWERTLNKGSISNGVDNYGNFVISYPEELGQIGANERLQNFVLFDIYDTGGQRLQGEKSEENLVNLEELKDLGGNFFRETFGFGGTGTTSDIAAPLSGSPEDLAQIVAAFGFVGLLASGNFAGFASGALAGLGIQAFAGKFLSNVITNKIEFSNSAYVDDLIAGKTLESYNSSALGLANKTQRIGLSIALPMPAQINSNYGMEYEDTDFSAMGTMMAGIRAYSSPNDNQV